MRNKSEKVVSFYVELIEATSKYKFNTRRYKIR